MSKSSINTSHLPPSTKIGVVKFFDENKGWGFITRLSDNVDYHVTETSLQVPSIQKDEMVLFRPKQSNRGLNAYDVTNEIPVFVQNKKDSQNRSYVTLLAGNSINDSIQTNRIEPGFFKVKAIKNIANWNITSFSAIEAESSLIGEYGPKLLSAYIDNFTSNKESISLLINHLNKLLSTSDLNKLFESILQEFEKKSFFEIYNEISTVLSDPYLISILERRYLTLNKISFVLWSNGKLSKLPVAKSQEEVDIWRNEIIPMLDWKSLIKVIVKLHTENGNKLQIAESIKYLISEGWKIETQEDCDTTIDFLNFVKDSYPNYIIKAEGITTNEDIFLIQLFQQGFLNEVPEETLLNHILGLAANNEKAKFIESLPPNHILSYYQHFPELTTFQHQYLNTFLLSEFIQIDYICFDLESDGNHIKELGWVTNETAKHETKSSNIETYIKELVSILHAGKLIIGHNIKAFDLLVLNKLDYNFDNGHIWDTLEMEIILNPFRSSFALRTEHSALADAKHTLELFKNQLSRIFVEPGVFESIQPFLPDKWIELFSSLRLSDKWTLIDINYLNTDSDRFFIPSFDQKIIPENIITILNSNKSNGIRNVVIAPDLIWNDLLTHIDLCFHDNDNKLNFYFSKDKLKDQLLDKPFIKAAVERYIDLSVLNGRLPYSQLLPTYIKLQLTEKELTSISDVCIPENVISSFTSPCVRPSDIPFLLSTNDRLMKDCQIIVIGEKLNSIVDKRKIGQRLDFAAIMDRLSGDPILAQLSGNTFISLSKVQIRKLNLAEIPDFVNNIWLEREGRGRFNVWSNSNFSKTIEIIGNKNIIYSSILEADGNKSNTTIIRPDTKSKGYQAEEKRVNPESLYKRLYYVYQFKLFECILERRIPSVLIVNNDQDIAPLQQFARKKGYFVPDQAASLSRQVELCHQQDRQISLMIIPFPMINRILEVNYLGPIRFIWDNLPLQEAKQMLSGEISINDATDSEGNQDDIRENSSNTANYSVLTIIKLYLPLIEYISKKIVSNHSDSELFLCDPRFSDFNGIEKSMNLNAISAQMWANKDQYNADLDLVSLYFERNHENAEFDLNTDEAKEILRQIFLPLEENGERAKWREYQHPYLDEILPAQKDLLISLPTGAGKSLLFQGPALFRSAFTCKLSLVIGPLRALMQDQVDALWEKGFYGNVEFLSGDKSYVEIRDIHRRVTGGEISLLYITPERFRSRAFENCLYTRMDEDAGLEYAIFDEAHCISQWGQEFRPDYLNSGRKVAGFPYPMRKLLFSATISDQVFEEIKMILPGVITLDKVEKTYNPVSDHIAMEFRSVTNEEDRLNMIAYSLQEGNFNPVLSRAIVFVKSRAKVEENAIILPDRIKEVFGENCDFSNKVGAFHARIDAEDRRDTYEKFKSGEIAILFATKAFGMGMDIPNIHFISHFSPPGTFEDYLQEVGRAGRNKSQREAAGFIGDNRIKAICLNSSDDFGQLKDQLHKSRISWNDIKDAMTVLLEYLVRFKETLPDDEIPVTVPFNLYSTVKKTKNEELDTKFRLALHWLEKLERIRLGYFTTTYFEIETTSLASLEARLGMAPDKETETVGTAILSLSNKSPINGSFLQIGVSDIRNSTKLSLENIFAALLKLHSNGSINLNQNIAIEPTKLRLAETHYFTTRHDAQDKYPIIRVAFDLATRILKEVPLNGDYTFNGANIDQFIQDSIQEEITFTELPWLENDSPEQKAKKTEGYRLDIIKKRSKHAFTIIRLLGRTKHKVEIIKEKGPDIRASIEHNVFNGYHKQQEWITRIESLEKDTIKLLDYLSEVYFQNNTRVHNWPDLIKHLNLETKVQSFSDILYILSVLGYCNSGDLLPTGIEVFTKSIDPIHESDLQSSDKIIYDEFEETRKVRELKLIALEVLAGYNLRNNGSESNIRIKQDSFIKEYFGCDSLNSLLELLLKELPDNDPLLTQWRGDAIKEEEDKLNTEQRLVYDAPINQNISVIAGPGSGKTHTLTLRVARLIHHENVPPDEILVLAYNRAVVTELKDRLGKLFKELGYGNLAKRIKIYTFHGLAKKYCTEQVAGLDFDKWENKLLSQLETAPGTVMGFLAPLRHILIDEFQDINKTRIKLLKKLQELTNAHLFIIGDPNQSIYGYERINDGGSLSPWPYYGDFNSIFKPAIFHLLNNHRSFPDILSQATQLLTIQPGFEFLIPKSVRIPENDFRTDYVQIINRTANAMDWWDRIPELLEEKIEGRKYRQIAILFRTNNEVYRGLQRIQSLKLKDIRIRIQGSLSYEFTRIRECYAVLEYIRKNNGSINLSEFKTSISQFIDELIHKWPQWNHFYLRVMHALVLEYLVDQPLSPSYEGLNDFISEMSYRDDGQLYKIYQKHIRLVAPLAEDTEIVLSTMHKVKGLEFDCVVIPPSFSNLPLSQNLTEEIRHEHIEEEKRLIFVACTRARFRLIVYRYERETSLQNNQPYIVPENINIQLGIPIQSGLEKLYLSWSAREYNFKKGVNDNIEAQIKNGDVLTIKQITQLINNQHVRFYEIFKEGSNGAIGQLSKEAANRLNGQSLNGYVVNEVVIWSYHDTLKYDQEHPGRNFASLWCQAAREKGYVYVVDFAGFGK